MTQTIILHWKGERLSTTRELDGVYLPRVLVIAEPVGDALPVDTPYSEDAVARFKTRVVTFRRVRMSDGSTNHYQEE